MEIATMRRALIIAFSLGAFALVSGFTVTYFGQRERAEFYLGHTHGEDGDTHGAPQHSGGLDRYGCHNASVPYHCH
jgi:hypothetical protein